MSTLDHAFFYNSDNHDRVYDADSFEHLLKKFFTTGVFSGSCRASAPGSGMIVQMGAGYSNVEGKVRFFQDVSEFVLANAHATYDRIDTIVIERNDIDRDITAKVVTGSYSAQPVATAPVREGGIYQLIVAEIYVTGGAVRITDADITDKRPDTSVCGYVLSAVQTPDFSELFAQFQQQTRNYQAADQAAFAEWRQTQESDMEDWQEQTQQDVTAWIRQTEEDLTDWTEITEADFLAWYARMKDQLSEDAAGHLQLEIDEKQDGLGLFIDSAGYICQLIGNETISAEEEEAEGESSSENSGT